MAFVHRYLLNGQDVRVGQRIYACMYYGCLKLTLTNGHKEANEAWTKLMRSCQELVQASDCPLIMWNNHARLAPDVCQALDRPFS